MNEAAPAKQRRNGAGSRVIAVLRDKPAGLKRPTTLKGWFLLSTGALLCPCHLPITLGILTGVLAGTASGASLADNLLLVGCSVALYSVTALILGYRMLSRTYGRRLVGDEARSEHSNR